MELIAGRGECVPYARYGETIDSVIAAIEAMGRSCAKGLDRAELQARDAGRAPRATRSIVRCGISKPNARGERAYRLAGLTAPQPLVTAYTISHRHARCDGEGRRQRAAQRPLLKVKLGAEGDPERIAAVRRAAPKAELIADANEGWTPENLDANLRACAAAGVTLVEQPLPAANDAALATVARAIPVCADESVHDRASLKSLVGKYDAVNIKLDKTGG